MLRLICLTIYEFSIMILIFQLIIIEASTCSHFYIQDYIQSLQAQETLLSIM